MAKTAFGLMLLPLALLAGCGGDTDGDDGDDGDPDASAPACRSGETKTESCNTCVCTDDGEWSCTTLPCPTTPGPACGARAGQTCSATEYCAYEEGQLCGAADAEARCKPRPDSCNDIASPVCACNGTTYANACEAASAGSGVNHAGECR